MTVAEQVKNILAPLVADLDGLPEDEFSSVEASVAAAREDLALSASVLAGLVQAEEELADLERLAALRDEVAERAPVLNEQLEAARTRVRELNDTRSRLEHVSAIWFRNVRRCKGSFVN